MAKANRIPDMKTYTTWMLLSLAGAILAILGGIIGNWTLLAASGGALLIFVTEVAKFYLPIQRLPKGA